LKNTIIKIIFSTIKMSVAGNQWFTNVNNNVLNSNTVRNAQQSGGLAQLNQVEGTLTPLAAGVYSFSGANNEAVQLPSNAVVLSAVLSSDTALAGGASISPFLTSAATGFTGPAIGSAASLANVNLGTTATGPNGPFIGSANNYLNATVVGTFTAGTARARIIYTDTHPGN
jgi:hypothetical protein